MSNYIITNNKKFFQKIGKYKYASLSDLKDLPEHLAVDAETTGFNPRKGHMFSVQIGTRKDNFLVDMQQLGGEITFPEVIPYLEDKHLIGHNLVFDLQWFNKHDFWPKKVYDTFVASKILYNGFKSYRHDFANVMERELGLTYDKSEQKNIARVQLSNSKSIAYAFNDVDRLLDLISTLGSKIRRHGYLDTYLLHCRHIRALAYIQQCGLPVDPDLWRKKMVEDKEASLNVQQVIIDYIYDHFEEYQNNQIDLFTGLDNKKITLSLSSNPQMMPVFEKLGIDIASDETASGKSLKEDVLKKSPHEFVNIWLEYKHVEHDVTTFGQKIIDSIEEDGRVYTRFNQIKDTARMSTRKNEINFLNFPNNERTRACFVAKPGFKSIVCDYDGQENVVGADMHNDPVMIKSINEGLDLHCAFARVLFPEELANLTDKQIEDDHSDLRQEAKSPRFAFQYGGSGFTVAQAKGIPLEEGNKIEKAFKELHAGVYEWGEEQLKIAMKRGYIKSADGFRLHLPQFDQWKDQWEKIKGYSSQFWDIYREGKEQRLLVKEAQEKGETYDVPKHKQREYDFYMQHAPTISWTYSKKGQYLRLCLNNPVQTTSAHQTKLATCLLFEEIEKRGDLWEARISNVPHDEIDMEVREDLADTYREILQNSMLIAGEYYLKSGLVHMGATAKIGDSWYDAK